MKFRASELADEFAVETYKQTRQLPKDDLLGPISQMCRVAASVAPNIVEGCSRNSTFTYVSFLEIAYGSSRELETPH